MWCIGRQGAGEGANRRSLATRRHSWWRSCQGERTEGWRSKSPPIDERAGSGDQRPTWSTCAIRGRKREEEKKKRENSAHLRSGRLVWGHHGQYTHFQGWSREGRRWIQLLQKQQQSLHSTGPAHCWEARWNRGGAPCAAPHELACKAVVATTCQDGILATGSGAPTTPQNSHRTVTHSQTHSLSPRKFAVRRGKHRKGVLLPYKLKTRVRVVVKAPYQTGVYGEGDPQVVQALLYPKKVVGAVPLQAVADAGSPL